MKTVSLELPMTMPSQKYPYSNSVQIGPSLGNDEFVAIQTANGVMYLTRDDAQKMATALLQAAINRQHTRLAYTYSL